jgi:type I restriction enzyme, S subunit
VVSAIGAYAGKTWFAIGKWSCIKNTIKFWSIDPEISNEYLYMATSGPNFWPLRGSAQPFISQTDARGLKVLFPSGDIAKKFGEVTHSIFRQLAENDIQNNYLGQVRGGLLPKLMNGEIEL